MSTRFNGLMIALLVCGAFVSVTASDTDLGQTPVFEGAEGFGTDTIAGSQGERCAVTTLSDNGPGSFRDCVERSGPRFVEFEVGGIIRLDSPLVITEPYISISGHSAPGVGVMVTNQPWVGDSVLRIATHDVLVRYMRFRAGDADHVNCCKDALSIGTREPGKVFNVVIDHNSLSWGSDEVVDIWYDANNITLSYNIISEGLHRSTNNRGPAGRGLIIGDAAHSISLHHNYFAHNYQRSPLIDSAGVVDVVNNLVYHWVSRAVGISAQHADPRVNLVKNVFMARDPADGKFQSSSIHWYDISLGRSELFKPDLYLEENRGYWRRDDSKPQWSLMGTGWGEQYEPSLGWVRSDRHPAPHVTELNTDDLPEHIVNNAGAILPMRDSVDQRLFDQYRDGDGYMPDCVEGCDLNTGGWPNY